MQNVAVPRWFIVALCVLAALHFANAIFDAHGFKLALYWAAALAAVFNAVNYLFAREA